MAPRTKTRSKIGATGNDPDLIPFVRASRLKEGALPNWPTRIGTEPRRIGSPLPPYPEDDLDDCEADGDDAGRVHGPHPKTGCGIKGS